VLALKKTRHDLIGLLFVGHHRVEVCQIEHRSVNRGRCKGCSVSPLLGSFYLLSNEDC
jgi:hypothetical protein